LTKTEREEYIPLLALESRTLPTNINLHLVPIEKFKTVLITAFLQQSLEKETAAKTALLPAVLERGTRKYPTYRDIRIRLEELYGAELGLDVLKLGERQILAFSLEVIHDKFAPGEDLMRQGLTVLKSVLTEPFTEEGVFKKEYVMQEKEQLSKEILGLVNDKVNYALERCIQKMCAGERFGVYKYGNVEDLEDITPGGLYEYYQSLISENPLDIFIVGEIDPQKTFPLIEETFTFLRQGMKKSLPQVEVQNKPKKPRYWEESLPVSQGKLTLGYRTNTAYRDEDYADLLFYNGILGGFPHSKLFQNVREKASLAYYAFSRLEKHKGIQLIGSGIESKNYEQAREIIEEQVENIKAGLITDEEMENTKRALINQYKIIGDSPSSLLGFFLDGIVGNRDEEVDCLIERFGKIKKNNVVGAAQKVALDSVYFLRSADNEGSE
jgi:predicted Zn-dependent peptidase